MALSLIITTLISGAIFIPLGYLLKNDQLDITKWYANFSLGGVGWVSYSIIALIPYYFLFSESSEDSYLEVMKDSRTGLFFILLVLSIISEIIRYELFKCQYFPIKTEKTTIVFGIGWGFAEFLTRFLFFFESDIENYEASVLLLLIFLMVSNAGLTTILIRSEENTKYVMFAAFIKFFTEIALFGALGHELEFSTRFGRLYFFLVVQIVMFYLTMKTRKRVSLVEDSL
ncbi:MAG: hypothetical protein GPJ54_00790 [Candidatus Heimdallarchaeota archaeon]|nr:hypothetical protein [Candidatus Heimdallarchaeota archaeon]